MTDADQTRITQLLDRLGEQPGAMARLSELVYQDIHRLAHYQRFEMRAGETLRTTALVHEAFLKIFRDGSADPDIEDRQHLMRLMGRVIRQIIVDHARRKLAEKRGAGAQHEPIDDQSLMDTSEREAAGVLDMESALERLERIDPDLADTVSARFFAGYTADEIASIKSISRRTVYRDLQRATAWLRLDMGG